MRGKFIPIHCREAKSQRRDVGKVTVTFGRHKLAEQCAVARPVAGSTSWESTMMAIDLGFERFYARGKLPRSTLIDAIWFATERHTWGTCSRNARTDVFPIAIVSTTATRRSSEPLGTSASERP